MALGMMPCSSSDVTVSKPVPIVYVFPAPVCVGKDRVQLVTSNLWGASKPWLGLILLTRYLQPSYPFLSHSHTPTEVSEESLPLLAIHAAITQIPHKSAHLGLD